MKELRSKVFVSIIGYQLCPSLSPALSFKMDPDWTKLEDLITDWK